MAGISDFLSMATSQLGISQDQAKSATGGLMGLIQQHAPADQFSQLTNLIPGAKDLIGAAAPAASTPAGGGGLMGALGGMLGGGKQSGLGAIAAGASALGINTGGLGQAAGLMDMLGKSGLSADKATGFVGLFAQFLKGQGGGDLLGKLAGSIPALKGLLG